MKLEGLHRFKKDVQEVTHSADFNLICAANTILLHAPRKYATIFRIFLVLVDIET
jgi:hypothetical protein